MKIYSILEVVIVVAAVDITNCYKFQCSIEYEKERQLYPSCIPIECGRTVSDTGEFLRPWIEQVLAQAKYIFKKENTSVSIVDVESQKIVEDSQIRMVEETKLGRLASLISEIVPRVLTTISRDYNIRGLGLTGPLLLSRISSPGQNSSHEFTLDYTTSHVDLYAYKVRHNLVNFFKCTSSSFQETLIHMTSIIYLQEPDDGGRLLFEAGAGHGGEEVRPVAGRLVTFTSGAENTHRVQEVTRGARLALTMFWTCDQEYFIQIGNTPMNLPNF